MTLLHFPLPLALRVSISLILAVLVSVPVAVAVAVAAVLAVSLTLAVPVTVSASSPILALFLRVIKCDANRLSALQVSAVILIFPFSKMSFVFDFPLMRGLLFPIPFLSSHHHLYCTRFRKQLGQVNRSLPPTHAFSVKATTHELPVTQVRVVFSILKATISSNVSLL